MTNESHTHTHAGYVVFVTSQVVLSKPVSGVAKDVVPHIRLPVLSPEELGAVEEENRKDHLLNVTERESMLVLQSLFCTCIYYL